MNKLNFNDKKDENLKISFHDNLVWNEISYSIVKMKKNILNYIILINIYFVLRNLWIIYKQSINTLWKDILNNFFRYWSLIYLIPLFILGIILPAGLANTFLNKDTSYELINIWISWIAIGACCTIFLSPYSLIITLLIYKKYIWKKFNNQLNKISK